MNSTGSQRTVWLAVFVLVVVLICLALGGAWYLPQLATRHLPVDAIHQLGFADFSGRITRIGWRQSAAGPILFGRLDNPAISIGSIVADYSLAGLRRKRIDCLRLADLTIQASLGPDGIVLPGLDKGALDGSASGSPLASASLPVPLDGSIGKVEIRSARVIVTWRNATYRIPFEADILTEGNGLAKLSVHLRLFPGDQPISLTAQLDLEKNSGDLALDGPAIHLDRFTPLFRQVGGLDVTGTLGLAATARLQLQPLIVSDVAINADWHNGRLTHQTVTVTPAVEDGSVGFMAVSAGLDRWRADVEGLQLQSPVPVTAGTISAALVLTGTGPSIVGQAGLSIHPFARRCPEPLTLSNELELKLAFNLCKRADRGWSVACHTLPSKKADRSKRFHLAAGQLHLQSQRPHIRLEADMNETGLQARWQADMPTVRVESFGGTAQLSQLRSEGRMKIATPLGKAQWSADARIRLPDVAVAGHGLAGRLKELVVSADLKPDDGRAPRARGRVRLAGGQMIHGASGIAFSGLRLNLPYDSDVAAAAGRGSFSAALQYRGRDLGRLQGTAAQKGGAFHLAAVHACPLLPAMTAGITGRVQPDRADLRLDIPAFDMQAGEDWGRWFPALKNVTGSGTVSAWATASVSADGIRGTGDLTLKNGRFEMTSKNLTVAGIDTSLHFPELPRLRSGPAQSLRFRRAALGGIVVDGGRFEFQVESPTTLFVEKGRLSWCGGTVDAQSLRVTAGKQEYALGLYCQRLQLSQILEQLGAVNAKGTGTVNGRIPLYYSGNRIHFDDGFLYSTPGETGQIQLTGTEVLTRGIPMGTPQFAQVDLAREALKDYAYKWAKLGMTTEDELLIMRLQFDGQPAGPLPFVYQKEIGSFVRVAADAQGSRFQGISLDVNLRLPLNRLLEYKKIVDRIE